MQAAAERKMEDGRFFILAFSLGADDKARQDERRRVEKFYVFHFGFFF
jgi:hypothetical protein